MPGRAPSAARRAVIPVGTVGSAGGRSPLGGRVARAIRCSCSTSSRRSARASASSTSRDALIGRPCSSHVYQLIETPASIATSSRRRPSVRRRPPAGSPTSVGEIADRRTAQELGEVGSAIPAHRAHLNRRPAARWDRRSQDRPALPGAVPFVLDRAMEHLLSRTRRRCDIVGHPRPPPPRRSARRAVARRRAARPEAFPVDRIRLAAERALAGGGTLRRDGAPVRTDRGRRRAPRSGRRPTGRAAATTC